jgi:hypothetical protein
MKGWHNKSLIVAAQNNLHSKEEVEATIIGARQLNPGQRSQIAKTSKKTLDMALQHHLMDPYIRDEQEGGRYRVKDTTYDVAVKRDPPQQSEYIVWRDKVRLDRGV